MPLRRSLALLGALACSAGAQAPSTDIFLASLSIQDGRVTVGAPVNITKRDGYDNQPSFTPDGRAILYTASSDGGQTDIYRYDIATKAITRVTNTPESEYSPTVMPDGKRFSVIRVERDSTQRLWSFALDGLDPRLVIESLKPVGYHAWLDASTLVMFVLGSPNAMVLGNLRTMKMDTIARGIGRSLAKLPIGATFTFTQRVDSATRVRAFMGIGRPPTDLVSLPRGVQDLAWIPDAPLLAATVVVGSGSKLMTWKRGEAAFGEVADLVSAGVTDITRLAVSPDGKWIAIVGAPRP